MTGKELSVLAERYLAGEIGYRDFMDSAPLTPKNINAWNLVDMIEHEPKLRDRNGNLTEFGTNYLTQVKELVDHLRGIDDELSIR